MITALLLAAGASRRFGAPKLIQDINGKPLIRWSGETLVDSPVDELCVVVASQHDAIRQALAGLNVRFVVNPNSDAGIGASIAAGVAGVGPETRAALVALGDEPLLDHRVVRRLVDRYRAGGDHAQIVVPTFRGERGHPVLFDRSVFSELAALTGDRGARLVIDRDPGRVALVEMNVDRPADVDTPSDLARARATVDSRSLLETVMPTYHVRAAYEMTVRAPVHTTYRAMMETYLADSFVTRLLMRARFLGRETFGAFRFSELPVRGTFFKLGARPGSEIVAGVMGRFWSLTGNVCDGDADTFHGALQPGTAKAAWNFRVEHAKDLREGSRLTTETRILCSDEHSRRQFQRYWTVIGPFSGLIRLETLRLIRRNAQFMASASNPTQT